MSDRNRKKTLPVSDAAHYLGISPETLRRWDQKGILKPFRTKGGQRRYSIALLKSFQSGERKPSRLSISQAARELGVHPETLRRWERDGEILAERTSGGQRRYTSSQIAKLEAAPQSSVLPPQEEKAPAPQIAQPPVVPGGLPPLASLPHLLQGCRPPPLRPSPPPNGCDTGFWAVPRT